MQFIEGGPHILDELIEQVEDGDAVLFAGAGVSKSIGLPLFSELVKQVYDHLSQPIRPDEQQEFDSHNYDRVLGLLETRIGPGLKVREAVKARLEIPDGQPLLLHKAVLDLARAADGSCRLVTTNFDRGFVMVDRSLGVEAAPAVPVPRKNRWYRPVHLHGLIGAEGRTLHDLVLTSADFGDAYIRSGWASRFVSELFAQFAVVFIGYSLSDPVMRYLVDALAVSRSRGEHSRRVYALVPADPKDEEDGRRSWGARGVDAVVYHRDEMHSRLAGTLTAWAEIHRNGHAGRMSVIGRFASEPPDSGEEDYRASQMSWALSDKSGQAARKFASLNPPIDWLPFLEKNGLIARPVSAHTGQSWLGICVQQPHQISATLHGWLLNHLDKQELIERAISQNAILALPVQWELYHKLWHHEERVPEPYRRFWQLIASSSVMNPTFDFLLKGSELADRLKAGTVDPLLFLEVLDQLHPGAVLSRPILRRLLRGDGAAPVEVGDLAEFDLRVAAGDSAREMIQSFQDCCAADLSIVPSALLFVTTNLERGLRILAAAGSANEDFDPTIFQMQSLRDDSSSDVHPWIGLIVLARELLTLIKDDKALARAIITVWLRIPFPVFLRLALFGMIESDPFEAAEAWRVLRELPRRRFWHYSNQEFLVPLTATLWQRLEEPEAEQLIAVIVDGPPRERFVKELSPEEFSVRSDQARLRFLSAAESTGRPLPPEVARKVADLRATFPETADTSVYTQAVERSWIRRPTEREVTEFGRLSVSAILDHIRQRDRQNSRPLDLFQTWAIRNPEQALDVLDQWEHSGINDAESYNAMWTGVSFAESLPNRLLGMIPRLNKADRTALADALLLSLQKIPKGGPISSEFLTAWDSLADIVSTEPIAETGKAFETAYSSQVARLTILLLGHWVATAPRRTTGIQPDVRDRLDVLIARADGSGRVARMMMASHLHALHLVDRPWALSALMPLFDWRGDAALGMWQGYLFNPRWYSDLLADLKSSFLEAFHKHVELGESVKSLWNLLAQVVVYHPAGMTDTELRDTLQLLGSDGLASLALAFVQILHQSESSERCQLWRSRMSRVFRLWPLDHELRSSVLSGDLATTAIYLEGCFEEVVDAPHHLLTPTQNLDTVVYRLSKTTIPDKHPFQVARLISAIIDSNRAGSYVPGVSRGLLLRLQAADSSVTETSEFRRLANTGWFEV